MKKTEFKEMKEKVQHLCKLRNVPSSSTEAKETNKSEYISYYGTNKGFQLQKFDSENFETVISSYALGMSTNVFLPLNEFIAYLDGAIETILSLKEDGKL